MSDEHTYPFYIVGVGASAGGLEALEDFFDNMKQSRNMAFVVVQHLSPDYKSLMGELLNRHTEMKIFGAEDGMEVEAGSIYLIPRKKNMTLFHGKLFLHEREHGLNLPIDIFFRSLAEEQGEHAIGIILSGTGSDGTRGVRAIKEAGGMVMVQDEETAKFDGMPRSAILTGIVDYILSPDQMSGELENYTTGKLSISTTQQHAISAERNSLSKTLALIKKKTGIDLSFYKENTVIRRIERRMGINQFEKLSDYVRYLEESPNEIQILYKEILIGVTSFFRDPEAYEIIKEKVLPEIANSKSPFDQIRVWVAGCSTGEEAYSLAIMILEFLEENELNNDVKVFATDIDRDALEIASYGIYPESIAADANIERLNKFFYKKGDSYQIIPKIREKVIFAYHNVFKDPPFGKIDLISCRNMLIYFQNVLQKKVLTNFQFSLNPVAFLFLGSSETVGEFSNYFSIYDSKWKIYSYIGSVKPKDINLDYQEIPASRNTAPIVGRNVQKGQYIEQSQMGKRDLSLYERLLEQFIPPSVLVNEERQVIHIFGDVNEYLQLPFGKMNLDILKMANSNLTVPMSQGLKTVQEENRDVHYRDIIFQGSKGNRMINMSIRVFQGLKGTRYFVITFQTVEDNITDEVAAQSFNMDESVKDHIDELERELQYTRDNLRSTIEELETSNEELQATNEELISSNEELQSTNEELQSVNEELITVNSEYQKKIEELTELNDDMNNLLNSTDIGTIFLDKDLTIRKFTPQSTNQINIIKSDIGRSISNFSHNLKYDTFIDDINEVIRTLNPRETEVQTVNDQWLLMKIQPYRAAGDQISGIVLSFVDITGRKKMESALKREQDLLMRVLKSAPIAITMVDNEGKIVMVNHEAEKILGMSEKELITLDYNSSRFQIMDTDGQPLDDNKLPFRQIADTRKAVDNFVHAVKRPDGTVVNLIIQGNPIFDEEGNVEGAVFSLRDNDQA